jgi:hypothetical protein
LTAQRCRVIVFIVKLTSNEALDATDYTSVWKPSTNVALSFDEAH